MSVVDAVMRDLARLSKLAPELADCAEAATALALAEELDAGNSATSKSMCASVLAKLMEGLREQAPEEAKASGLDDLTKRREERLRARGNASA